MEIQKNEIKIVVPSGMEIDKENSTFECIKFKPSEKELPKTWKEFCETHPRKRGESWFDEVSEIGSINRDAGRNRSCIEDRNLLPNKEYAEAMLALCQLIQLRDCYNDGWVPDWTANEYKACIEANQDQITIFSYKFTSKVLAFKTAELRDQFLKNFKDLIEIAKPLL